MPCCTKVSDQNPFTGGNSPLAEGDTIVVLPDEAFSLGVEVGVNVACFFRSVVVHVRFCYRSARQIVRPSTCAVWRGGPAVTDGSAIVVEVEPRSDEVFLRCDRRLLEHLLDLRIVSCRIEH